MTSPDTRAEHLVADARAPSTEIKIEADVLRQVAKHDGDIDAHRGDVSLALAGLIEACALHYTNISPLMAQEVFAVVDAVDRAIGRSRSTGT
ncbi:hypothetical protein [Pseudonocardia sp. GCM10023141]|uniref:hypothetical protein n=1 Tax=Pseudonocardia sp. GCM10023141 TaxID=3252653 RepID=UPI00361820EC